MTNTIYQHAANKGGPSNTRCQVAMRDEGSLTETSLKIRHSHSRNISIFTYGLDVGQDSSVYLPCDVKVSHSAREVAGAAGYPPLCPDGDDAQSSKHVRHHRYLQSFNYLHQCK